MGHVINPISQRLGYTRYWSTNWALANSTKNANYSFLVNENILIISYIKKILFLIFQRFFVKGWLITNLQIVRFYSHLSIICTAQLGAISRIRRILLKTVDDFFCQKKIIFKLRCVQSDTINNKRILNQRFFRLHKLLTNYPYKKHLQTICSATTLFDRIKKLPTYKFSKNFLDVAKKITNFDSSVNIPDIRAYTWGYFSKILSLRKQSAKHTKIKKLFPRDLERRITYNLLKCLILGRWLLIIKKLLFKALHKIFVRQLPFDIFLVCITRSSLTANFIAKYIATRLLQKFPLRRLVNNVVRQLKLSKEHALIQGFKLSCSGRFARRGRATHIWKAYGKLPRSNTNIFVDYSIMLPVLTNSICAIKVWLTKTNDTIKQLVI